MFNPHLRQSRCSIYIVFLCFDFEIKSCKNRLRVCFTVYTCINIFFYFMPGLPVVSVTYSAQWSFDEILPSKCNNISTRLDVLEEEIVGIFANKCQEQYGIYATVHFTYSFLAFTVHIQCTYIFLYTCISLVWLYSFYQLISHIIS